MTQPLTAERDGYHAGLARRNRPRIDLLTCDASAWFAAWLKGKAERLVRIRRHEMLPRELADEVTAWFGGVQTDYEQINARPARRREMRKKAA